jgi:hypothetical protein
VRGEGSRAVLVAKLEATAEGCRWLLGQCAELRTLQSSGAPGEEADLHRFIHLLGNQRYEAVTNPALYALRAAEEAAEMPDRAAFDPSAGFERHRRYRTSLGRELLRTLDTQRKLRKDGRDMEDAGCNPGSVTDLEETDKIGVLSHVEEETDKIGILSAEDEARLEKEQDEPDQYCRRPMLEKGWRQKTAPGWMQIKADANPLSRQGATHGGVGCR